MSETPADWYPDPMGRHEMRYHDGTRWTEHVASNGRQSVDPVETAQAKQVHGTESAAKISRQVDRHFASAERRGTQADPSARVGAGLLDQRIFVVNQKAKLIEVNNEYAIFNRDGAQIGAVRQVGQSNLKKALRVLASVDQFMTHNLQIVDSVGTVVLTLTRPAKFVKSRVIVNDGAGSPVGEVTQQNVFGKISFGLTAADGSTVGSINAENWRAWNFNIQDSSGTEVARITKTFEGVLKTAFTTADNYVVEVHRELTDPLRQLVIASALSVDTALKQDSRGFG